MNGLTVHITCPGCGSGVHVYPSINSTAALCEVCQTSIPVKFDHSQENGEVRDCPVCFRKDFYKQKDFNRKMGVLLFILASILSIFTYGLSFVVLYLVDYFLFKKLSFVVVCYHCQTIFRDVRNISEIGDFDHEMNDRIVYSGHDFQGRPLTHK